MMDCFLSNSLVLKPIHKIIVFGKYTNNYVHLPLSQPGGVTID